MSPIALGLDLLLAALLLTALVMGARLNGRLKALRGSQADFVKAVAELDQAAARAESGLADLRRATEDTHDQLLTRIETARGLIAKLERASLEAERVINAAPPPPLQSQLQSQSRAAATPPSRSLAAIAALAEGRTEGRGAEARAAPQSPDSARRSAAAEPPLRMRSRARSTFDHDLFDPDAPLDLGPLRGRRKDDR
jgi:ABC-type transporter Mla subunit MlaD